MHPYHDTWTGVFPAVMTQMHPDGSLNLEATAHHIDRLIAARSGGLIVLGTLGENTVLSREEKRDVLRIAIDAVDGRVPVLCGVAETTTEAAVGLAEAAHGMGADGLMVLPPMVYTGDRRETLTHFRTVAAATDLPVMVYNNPIAYRTDVTVEMLIALSDSNMIVAVKESSEDPRRITDLINAIEDRYVPFCGVDDLILEYVSVGCTGWVAGLVNAFPEESVALFEAARRGDLEAARAWYRWFMPLLHLDTGPKLIQAIKLCMALTNMGAEWCRPPRLPLEGAEREDIEARVRRAIDTRPPLPD